LREKKKRSGIDPGLLVLLLYAFVFVVKAVVGAIARVAREKVAHIILVQGNQTNVCVVFLVVIVKLTALAAALNFFLILCHTLAFLSVRIISHAHKCVNACL
jgi:hypothetical protein